MRMSLDGSDGPLHDGQTVAVQGNDGHLSAHQKFTGMAGFFSVLADGVEGAVDVSRSTPVLMVRVLGAGVGQFGNRWPTRGLDLEPATPLWMVVFAIIGRLDSDLACR